MITYHPIGQARNTLGNSKPENTIAQETKNNTNRKQSPWRELVAGNAREQTYTLSNIVSHPQDCYLLLVKTQH